MATLSPDLRYSRSGLSYSGATGSCATGTLDPLHVSPYWCGVKGMKALYPGAGKQK
jgi:hypothetical protein